MLGLSPIGIVVPFLIFAFSDICKGALGSGLRCELPFAAEYVEAVALYFEISFMFLIGFVWLFVAFRVWYKFFVNVAGFIQSLFFKPF